MPARPSRSSAVIVAVAIVIAAALLSPVGAVAAGQLVEISSVSGRKADVTRAEQLQTAEASPHQFVRGNGSASDTCSTVLAAPATKAVVVKTIVIDVYAVTSPGPVLLYVGTPSSCNASFLMIVDAATIGTIVLDLEPGVAVPAGGRLSSASSSVDADIAAVGYKVVDTAVPAAVAPAAAPDRALR